MSYLVHIADAKGDTEDCAGDVHVSRRSYVDANEVVDESDT